LEEEVTRMDTFLDPIEKPKGLVKKLMYAMMKRQFGKVPTPIKVVYSRMPTAFGMFVGKIAQLDKKLELPQETAMLIREQVAHINVCTFCVDIGRYFVIKASMNEAKFNALDQYRVSPLFSEAERAALDYVTQLTASKKVDSETIERVKLYYSDRAICDMVWLAASEHFYNITNLGLNIHSDMLCDLARKR
jgi:alkylhydroperoxidase family enzyme